MSVIDAYLVGNAGGGPKDRRLFQKTGWPAQFFHPELREVLDAIEKDETQMESEPMSPATKLKVLSILREEAPGIYSFPMLTPEACGILITEIEHFSSEAVNLPIRRPNSMNNHGVVVNEMGMERAVDALQRTVLAKIAEALYPEQGGGCLNSHHSFVVQYKEGLDVGLDLHTDDSDVTFNVCLGKEFAGAELTFCGVLGADVEKGAAPHRRKTCAYQHQKGRCVVHLGAHRHGADDLQTGERLNLILWNHSSTYRASEAYKWRDVPPELEPPSLVSISHSPHSASAIARTRLTFPFLQSGVSVLHARSRFRRVQAVPHKPETRRRGVEKARVVPAEGGTGQNEVSVDFFSPVEISPSPIVCFL